MSSSCCTPDNSCNTGTTAESVSIEGVSTVYAVSGITCGHCKDTLTKTIGALDGVSRVDVDLEAGQVTVISAAKPDDKAIADVVNDAGYEVTGLAA
ncbi:cation transporter [Streptomyces sp. NPDC051572]|uniref:heavy-metal-associated domain-containing protein n=1 Tax=unclassified Streptomyces TaxID=2593676 RepID=UPI00344C6267